LIQGLISRIHGYVILFGAIAVAAFWFAIQLSWSVVGKQWYSVLWRVLVALGLFAGAVTFPLGVLLQTFSHAAFPRAVTIAGSAFVIAALAGILAGVCRRSTALE